jgi:hypothetical protein
MSTFGSKEVWMEPMNQFLSAHREEFKTFIDEACTIETPFARSPSSNALPPPPPAYSTPIAILNRLPPTSREGFPSLPYLIDHARNFAALIQAWLGSIEKHHIRPEEKDLRTFHELCVELSQRTQNCLERAERAERPTSGNSLKWEALVESLENVHLPPNTIAERRKSSAATAVPDEGTPRVRSFISRSGMAPISTRGSNSASASASSVSLADDDAPLSAALEKTSSNGGMSLNGLANGSDSNISSPITPHSATTRRPQTFFPPPAISTSTSASESVSTSARPSPTSYLDSQDSSDTNGGPTPLTPHARHRARSSGLAHDPISSTKTTTSTTTSTSTSAISHMSTPIPERTSSIPFAAAFPTPPASHTTPLHPQNSTRTATPPSTSSTTTTTTHHHNPSPYMHSNSTLSTTFSDPDDAPTTALPEYTPHRDRDQHDRGGWDRQRVVGRKGRRDRLRERFGDVDDKDRAPDRDREKSGRDRDGHDGKRDAESAGGEMWGGGAGGMASGWAIGAGVMSGGEEGSESVGREKGRSRGSGFLSGLNKKRREKKDGEGC